MTQDSKSNTLRAGKKRNFLTLEWFGQTQQKISQLICLKDGEKIECKHCLGIFNKQSIISEDVKEIEPITQKTCFCVSETH